MGRGRAALVALAGAAVGLAYVHGSDAARDPSREVVRTPQCSYIAERPVVYESVTYRVVFLEAAVGFSPGAMLGRGVTETTNPCFWACDVAGERRTCGWVAGPQTFATVEVRRLGSILPQVAVSLGNPRVVYVAPNFCVDEQLSHSLRGRVATCLRRSSSAVQAWIAGEIV